MPSPLTPQNTIGPVVFAMTIPAANNYAGPITVTASLQSVLIGAQQMSASSNQWNGNGTVGTTSVDFSLTFLPPAGNNIGALNCMSMTETIEGQPPQKFSGVLASWISTGTQLVPPQNQNNT